MEAMKCNNLLYIPIVEYFIIASCKQIDLNCLTGDQQYTKCLDGTQSSISVISKYDHYYFLSMWD